MTDHPEISEKTPVPNFLRKYGLVLLVLFGLYGLSIGLKAHLFHPYDHHDEFSPVYNTEAAVHLRYAAMAARGEKIPALDIRAEYPDGFAVFQRSEIFEELVAGGLHRLPGLDRVPIQRFVEYFDWAWSGLSLFALFLFCMVLTGNRAFSLLAALAYSIAAPALLRTVNGFFIREIFTLPFIFFHLSFVLLSFRKGGWKYPALASLFMLAIVASWQMWRFVYMAVFVFILVKYFANNGRQELKNRIAWLVTGHAAAFLLAAIAIPSMRAQGGLSEIPISLTLGAAVFMQIELWFRRIPRWLAGLAGLLAAGCLILFVPGTREHNYIYVMALLKIRYFLAKPPDPAAVPLIVRMLWAGPFNSPSLREALYMPLTYWLWGILSFVLLGSAFIRGKTDDARGLFLYLLAGYAAGFIFFSRLSVFLIFFLCAGIAVVLSELDLRDRKSAVFAALAVLACLGMETKKTWELNSLDPFLSGVFDKMKIVQPVRNFSSRVDTALDIVSYIRSSVPENAAILTRYAFSGFLLYYTGRPVFLSPLYGKQTSDKIRLYTEAMFGPEENFYRLCKKNGVSYVVYQSDIAMLTNSDSERYMIDRLSPGKDETVSLMHYSPADLKHFILVHQNPFMRVYRRNDLAGPAPDASARRNFPLYDGSMAGRLAKRPNDLFLDFQEADGLVFLANRFFQAGRIEEAAELNADALRIFPFHAEALLNAGRLEFSRRNMEQAVRYFEAAYRLDPGPDERYAMSMTLLMAGRNAEAAGQLRKILEEDPCHLAALSDLCLLSWMAGRKDEAVRTAGRIASCGQDKAEVSRILGDLYQRMGRPEEIRGLLEKTRSLPDSLPSPGRF